MRVRLFEKSVLAALVFTLALPVHMVAADQPAAAADVALSADGKLSGQVMTPQGISLENVPVVLERDGVEIARTMTAADGQFELTGVAGGTYVVESEGGAVLCRAWVAQTAPPVAQQGLLVVSGDEVQRATFGPATVPVIMVATFVGVAAGMTVLDDDNAS